MLFNFKNLILFLGFTFAVLFGIIVVPPFLKNPDLIAAFGGGFVNPYSTGYSLDTVFCWMILAVWVFEEAKEKKIKNGWIAVLLGIVPGVATGFALYLIIRLKQEKEIL